ncbi:MAG: hypothetical protein ACJAYU_001667 [Bradymonadia bacterium]|jgi:hypothetical protein
MADEKETDGALQKATPQEYLTYAKWGLMGIGGLWVAKMVIGTLLSPLGLVGLAGAGAGGFWYFNRSEKTEVQPATDADTLRAEAEQQAEEELTAVEVSAVIAPPPPSPNGPPPESPVEKFDRLAVELERMKSKMSND